MKKSTTLTLALLLASLDFGVSASTSMGKVISCWVHNTQDNSFIFMVDGQKERPACASFGSPHGRYAVDMNTDKGRLIASAIMAAKASASVVYVHGKGTCELYSDSEDVYHVAVH
ncbi:MAG: hypothetical protein OXE99_09645 [Cellvibrionales bacterium]|nr:hypothetical protein [Cellvibrionales bacterium]